MASARYYVGHRITTDDFVATDGVRFRIVCRSEKEAGDLVKALNYTDTRTHVTGREALNPKEMADLLSGGDVRSDDIEGLHGIVLNLVLYIDLLQTRVAQLDDERRKIAHVLQWRAPS